METAEKIPRMNLTARLWLFVIVVPMMLLIFVGDSENDGLAFFGSVREPYGSYNIEPNMLERIAMIQTEAAEARRKPCPGNRSGA